MACDTYSPQQLAHALSATADRAAHRALLEHLASPCPECLHVVGELDGPEFMASLAGPDAVLSDREAADMFSRVQAAVPRPNPADPVPARTGRRWLSALLGPRARWSLAVTATGLVLLVGLGWLVVGGPKGAGVKSGGAPDAIESARLQAYIGTAPAGPSTTLRRAAPGDVIGRDEVLFFRTHLSQPAHCALLLLETRQVLWIDPEIRPEGSAEVGAGGRALALPGSSVPDGASLILLASPDRLSEDALGAWLRESHTPADLLDRCPGCAFDVLRLEGRP